jgi:hypothetical protein
MIMPQTCLEFTMVYKAKIQEQTPLTMFDTCAAHSLNLVGTSAAESSTEATSSCC